MTESTMPLTNAGQAVVTAVARQIERMTKEEVQALVARSLVDLQAENAALKARVGQLENENKQLVWAWSRALFDPKDYENFDPNQPTVSWDEMMAVLHEIKDRTE